ncbi:hypothetical protein [uncultured Clostridium sp.]|jgi:hypothetical protein|nr:hypothetical protein [uncultured Clostridium sp.]
MALDALRVIKATLDKVGPSLTNSELSEIGLILIRGLKRLEEEKEDEQG